MQDIEKAAFRNTRVEQVKLLPMSNQIRNDWLRKWAAKCSKNELQLFIDTACLLS
jgi:hypothetical protein